MPFVKSENKITSIFLISKGNGKKIEIIFKTKGVGLIQFRFSCFYGIKKPHQE
jgi:hypothetical protein